MNAVIESRPSAVHKTIGYMTWYSQIWWRYCNTHHHKE